MRLFRVKSEIQTLRTESCIDFKSDSGSLGLYLHIFSMATTYTGEWRDCLKLTCASLDRAVR